MYITKTKIEKQQQKKLYLNKTIIFDNSWILLPKATYLTVFFCKIYSHVKSYLAGYCSIFYCKNTLFTFYYVTKLLQPIKASKTLISMVQ